MAEPTPPFDFRCQTCGACCVQLDTDKWDPFPGWARVTPADAARLTPRERRGVNKDTDDTGPRTRLIRSTHYGFTRVVPTDPTPSGAPVHRCYFLDGKVGGCVSCTIYDRKPEVCTNFTPGEPMCLDARRAFGLPVPPRDPDED